MNLSPDHVPSTETAVTEDGLLGGRVRVLQPRRGYRIAIDAVLLAAAVEVRAGDKVLDLGAGVAAIGLCLAARASDCTVVGLELQPELVQLAERSASLNRMGTRVRTVEHDLALPLPADLGLFDHVVSNPPYLPAAVADPSPDHSKALATVESSAGLARWLEVAAGAATPAGTLTLIHRTDRLDEIAAHLEQLGWSDLAVKRLLPAARVLVRARRSMRPVRQETAPMLLHNPEGGYTDEAEAILRHAAPLAF
jgi:tRNA1(Val) A37 N6-methylase TrmN6